TPRAPVGLRAGAATGELGRALYGTRAPPTGSPRSPTRQGTESRPLSTGSPRLRTGRALRAARSPHSWPAHNGPRWPTHTRGNRMAAARRGWKHGAMSATTGVIFLPQSPPEDLRGVVEAAEQSGIHELWLFEDCFLEGGLTASTAALSWSQNLRVAIGLLPVPLRNPAVTAMEIATVARLFPGRFVPGLGHGVLDWMRQVG